ncbi:hypothetical protein [Halorubrum tebenquichense]|uniref:hypothetical protein n=1 Tax=Halorubrum tebenquichense TaxID=119434 RepID=UPI0006781BF9|nr:hypothetical protein [Halorubrum tebenquichense]
MTKDAASLIDDSLSRDVDIDEALSDLDQLEERAEWDVGDFAEWRETRDLDLDSEFSGGFRTPKELVE